MNALRHSNTAFTLPMRLPATPFMVHLLYIHTIYQEVLRPSLQWHINFYPLNHSLERIPRYYFRLYTRRSKYAHRKCSNWIYYLI